MVMKSMTAGAFPRPVWLSIVLGLASGREVLAAIREIGVRIALDDFGTGYSSLGHLQASPLDNATTTRVPFI
jgi:predicted signal transduction protein with EAL and GGDEF domain